jgi:hypothetical protein
MDKELKAKWVAALRSGDYKQGHTTLRAKVKDAPDRFCCLGVLCDVAEPEGWTAHYSGAPEAETGEYAWPEHTYGTTELYEDALDECLLTENQQSKLIQLNDVFKETFDKIADHIEAVL